MASFGIGPPYPDQTVRVWIRQGFQYDLVDDPDNRGGTPNAQRQSQNYHGPETRHAPQGVRRPSEVLWGQWGQGNLSPVGTIGTGQFVLWGLCCGDSGNKQWGQGNLCGSLGREPATVRFARLWGQEAGTVGSGDGKRGQGTICFVRGRTLGTRGRDGRKVEGSWRWGHELSSQFRDPSPMPCGAMSWERGGPFYEIMSMLGGRDETGPWIGERGRR